MHVWHETTNLVAADGVEEDGRRLCEDHMAIVGVRQMAAPQQQPHEVAGMTNHRLCQIGT